MNPRDPSVGGTASPGLCVLSAITSEITGCMILTRDEAKDLIQHIYDLNHMFDHMTVEKVTQYEKTLWVGCMVIIVI